MSRKQFHMNIKYFRLVAVALALLAPLSIATAASAATSSSFEVSGWLPYWTAATSSADVMPHLSELTEINPFVYTMTSSGTIIDSGSMTTGPWPALIAAAKAQNVRVVPTIMWSNGAAIYNVLSVAKTRQALETNIAKLVKQNNYDGIDIDFEDKTAATEPYFSLFLQGLYSRMGNKFVTCDIEARTPIAEEYYGTDIPVNAGQYANDYVQINKYCDRVHLMTYDQQGVDGQLAAVAASSSELYAPVADPAWVQSVVNLAKLTINPKKIIVGIPTYGYEYQVTAYANNQYLYDILWTFDPKYAGQIEAQYNVAPTRNSAGEETLTYVPNPNLSTSTPNAFPNNPAAGLVAAVAASLYATTYNSHLSFNMLDWSDAQSVTDKVALAKALGVRGVALFEFDGGEDPNIWAALFGVKKS